MPPTDKFDDSSRQRIDSVRLGNLLPAGVFCPNCSKRKACPFHKAFDADGVSKSYTYGVLLESCLLGTDLLSSLNGSSEPCLERTVIGSRSLASGCEGAALTGSAMLPVDDKDDASTEACGSDVLFSCTESEVASEGPNAPSHDARRHRCSWASGCKHQELRDEHTLSRDHQHRDRRHGKASAGATLPRPNKSTTEREGASSRCRQQAHKPAVKYELYVGNLPDGIQESDLHALFGEFGKLVQVRLPLDRVTFEPRGFAFVSFCSKDAAQSAVDALDRCGVGHSIVQVRWA